ncbi:MAG: hypothetical protein HKP09_04790 [Enterobacterales bacterium]|nr:hypothetical protein [Enterobacterales bacterium]
MKTLFILLIFAASTTFAAAPDFIKECMDCHGPNGISLHDDMPTIAGASPYFIEATFAAYKYDLRDKVESKYRFGDMAREPTNMVAIAKKLSDKQVQEAAKFFSKQLYIPAKQEFDPKLVNKGKKLHLLKCEKCHTKGGTSAMQDAPILAGQWTPYLKGAVAMILREDRDVDERMARTVKQLSDDEWAALFSFYASQQ